MEVLAILIMGAVNVACFIVGAKVGAAVRGGKDIGDALRPADPIEAYKAHREKKEARKEQTRMETIMRNIESYDGSPNGQREVK